MQKSVTMSMYTFRQAWWNDLLCCAFLLTALQVRAQSGYVFPHGWKTDPVTKSSYYVVGGSWNAGRQNCEALGGHLLVINSDEEMTRIRELPGLPSRFWIGLYRDPTHDAVWRWVNSSSWTIAWADGEPNNADDNADGREDCAELIVGLGINDRGCSVSESYVCEKPQGNDVRSQSGNDVMPQNSDDVMSQSNDGVTPQSSDDVTSQSDNGITSQSNDDVTPQSDDDVTPQRDDDEKGVIVIVLSVLAGVELLIIAVLSISMRWCLLRQRQRMTSRNRQKEDEEGIVLSSSSNQPAIPSAMSDSQQGQIRPSRPLPTIPNEGSEPAAGRGAAQHCLFPPGASGNLSPSPLPKARSGQRQQAKGGNALTPPAPGPGQRNARSGDSLPPTSGYSSGIQADACMETNDMMTRNDTDIYVNDPVAEETGLYEGPTRDETYVPRFYTSLKYQ